MLVGEDFTRQLEHHLKTVNLRNILEVALVSDWGTPEGKTAKAIGSIVERLAQRHPFVQLPSLPNSIVFPLSGT